VLIVDVFHSPLNSNISGACGICLCLLLSTGVQAEGLSRRGELHFILKFERINTQTNIRTILFLIYFKSLKDNFLNWRLVRIISEYVYIAIEIDTGGPAIGGPAVTCCRGDDIDTC